MIESKPGRRMPRGATVVIAALTALAWLVTAGTGADQTAAVALGFIPARFSGALDLPGAVPALLTPLTSTFVHGGLLHLAFNMFMLVLCGLPVEGALGRFSLLILYLVGAYVAALAQFAVDPAGVVPMIGASGAVSAVIGAYSLSFGRPKRFTGSARLNRWINALWLLAAWVVLQLLFGFAAGIQGVMVATAAHIGGFIAGLLLQRPLLLWQYRNA